MDLDADSGSYCLWREKNAGEKFAGVVPTSPAICPTRWLTESNIPERFPMIPLMIMLLSQSVICSRILCMSRLLPYANTPNSFAIRDRSINSCEKRDSADAVVVRNAVVPLGKDSKCH